MTVPEDIDPETGELRWGAKLKAEIKKDIAELRGEVHDLKEGTVTHRGLLGWAGGLIAGIVVAVGGVMWWGVDRADKAKETAVTETRAITTVAVAESHEAVDKLSKVVDQNKREATAQVQAVQADVVEGRKDTKGIYNFLLSGRRQARFAAPIEATIPEVVR
jgi:hypothetical protein